MDIGFLDKEKLKNIIMEKCKTKKDKEICNAFFDGNPEKFLIDVVVSTLNKKGNGQEFIQQNKTRLEWLIKHCTAENILQARNENFKGKIVVNGDLYSDRIILLLMNSKEYKNWANGERTISCENVKQLITDVNNKCFKLMKDLNNRLNIVQKNKQIFLIAGNHDLYESDFFLDEKYDCLTQVKNDTLQDVELLKFVKFKIGDKTIVFKHSPYLSQDALHTIKRNKYKSVQDDNIRKYPKNMLNPKHAYYWRYASVTNEKYRVNQNTIFCNEPEENTAINKQLQENNYYMVFGHCGTTASNSSTFSIIDKDWDNYQYSKFSIDKKQLKHEVYNAKNERIITYDIPNFEKAKRRDEKFNNKKLSIASNDNIYFQQQKKHFDVLEAKKQEEFSIKNKQEGVLINNNGLKKEQSTKTEHKMEIQHQIDFSLNNVDKSNSYFNSCCNKIYNICG